MKSIPDNIRTHAYAVTCIQCEKLMHMNREAPYFSEVAAADGNLKGCVKPIATNVSILDISQDGNILSIIWQSIASLFAEVFENKSKDKFVLRIPIEGSLRQPDQNYWSAFISIFKNTFEKSFVKGEDGTINFKDALGEQE